MRGNGGAGMSAVADVRPALIGHLERYERGSVLMTSNLPFSKWEEFSKTR
jgi:hypothetical protein